MSSDAAVNVYLWLDGGVFYRRLSLTDLLVVLPSGLYLSELFLCDSVEDDVSSQERATLAAA